MQAYKCTNCGATINFDENCSKAICEFCGTVHTLSQPEFTQDIEDDVPVFIIEKTLTVDDCIKDFVKSLSEQPYILRETLSNIEIKSVHEKYHLFSVCSADFEGSFNGTACYDREESYVDYVSKTVKVGDRYETVKEPVTRYRTVTDRRPASGNFSSVSVFAGALSKPLFHYLEIEKDLAPKETTDISLSNGSRVLDEFEENILDLICNIDNPLELTDENEAMFGDKSEFQPNSFINNRFAEKAEENFNKACQISAELACPGEYCENVNETHHIIDEKSIAYLIPLCTIVYECNGKTFYSIQAMSNHTQVIAMSYPENITLLQREIEYVTENVKSVTQKLKIANSNPAGSIALICLLVFTAYFVESFILWIFTIAISGFLIWQIVEKYQKKKESINNMDKITADLRKENADTQDILRHSYDIFVEEYDKTHDTAKAFKAISKKYPLEIDDSKFGYRFSNKKASTSVIDSLNTPNEETRNIKGKVFLTVGKRFYESNGLIIYLDGEEKFKLAGNDRIEIPVHKDGQLGLKEESSDEITETINVSANQVTVVKVDYYLFGLKVKSESKEMPEQNYKSELEFEEECLKKFEVEAENNSISGKAKRFIKEKTADKNQ